MHRFFKHVSVAALALGLVACRSQKHTAPHEVLSASAEALRTSFNADAGKVRILMLVSPT